MTELYQAYGGLDDMDMSSKVEELHQQQEMQHDTRADPRPVPPPDVPKREKKQEVQKGPVERFSNQSYQETDRLSRRPSYSFWDRMVLKRPEVIKLAIFSLVIVLAISLDRIGTFYMSKYIGDNILTDFQELMLRMSYPIIVFIVLWVIKSL